ncbi:MAG TPA: DNA mismatch repair protein MutS, partial [candidate division WWE3 bacterium]|nr:DNA mismatch repair protein MutS [candidate division WWE3 bacterium]
VLSFKQYTNIRLVKLLKELKTLKLTLFEDFEIYSQEAETFLKNHFNIKSLESYGIHNKETAEVAAGLLGYLKNTQSGHITNLKRIIQRKAEQTLQMDISTINNLEILKNIRTGEKEGSLLNVLDKTHTAFGGRLFKKWLLNPLVKKEQIQERLDLVEYFIHKEQLRINVEKLLRQTKDIERIISRITLHTENPKDVILLKDSLIKLIEIKEVLQEESEKEVKVKKILKNIKSKKLKELNNIIEKTLVEEPPTDPKQGSLIKKGVNQKLDSLKEEILGSQEWIAELETKEKAKTNIPSLKVRYNKVFGYYIEVSKSYAEKVPKEYLRKQTLVNAERYITAELKEHEEKVLKAEEEINDLEYEIFKKLITKIKEYVEPIQKSAREVAKLDILISFSNTAIENAYTKPKIHTGDSLEIIEGRHPVVEKAIENPFIPNSLTMDSQEKQVYILTGPNMAGKSVFARQIALIAILAQCGSYVPAKRASIGIIDKVFVRSGASDFISSGMSTFMVEMVETANILNNATTKSLIILDEVGRGTGTKDGIAIATAVAEYLIYNPENKHPKTLFATHYHELQSLEKEYPNKVTNIRMAVKEEKNKVIFLHKVVKGAANHSYGIEVAKLAGIPEKVIKRSKELLKNNFKEASVIKNKPFKQSNPLIEEIKKIN